MENKKLGFLASALLFALSSFSSELLAQTEDFSNAVTSRISERTDSFAQSNGSSFNPRVSKNGRFVVFESTATNLVPDPFQDIDWDSSDSSRRRIYLYDRQANTLELVSLNGTNSDSPYTDIKADCFNPVVSNDGRYVAFTVAFDPAAPVEDIVNVCFSDACHVNIAHQGQHIYVRDRLANDTMLVSQVSAKVRRQLVLFGVPQVIEGTTCASDPAMETLTKRIAARVIADCTDIPPYDNSTDTTVPTGQTGPLTPRCDDGGYTGRFEVAKSDNARISADGRYIVFDSDSNSLSFVSPDTDNPPGPIAGLSTDPDWYYCCSTMSSPCAAGTSGVVNSISRGHGNIPFEWSIFTASYDDATYAEWYRDDDSKNFKIRDVYLRDGSDYSTKILSNSCKYHEPGVQCDLEAVEDAIKPSISDDGTLISFETKSRMLSLDFNIGYQSFPNIPNAGDDIFVVERSQFNGEIAKISRVSNNTTRILAGNGNSTNALLSADGRYVAYQSTASNLVLSDSNGFSDVFLFDRAFNRTLLCSKTASGTLLNAASTEVTVSGSGEYVAFESAASNSGFTSSTNTISQAYIAKVSKNSDGSLKDCALQLASVGNGTGAQSVSNPAISASVIAAGIAVVPQTIISGGTTTRIQRSSVVYESAADNLDSSITDTNQVSDIFQAPICNSTDSNTDTDGDGTTDCFDQCYRDPIKVEDSDTDSDGFANCEDGCPTDPQKSGPATCGCGVPEIDSDADGTYDCKDTCPNDPGKIAPGACGCGNKDTDANGNGTADCNDSTLPTPAPTATPVGTATPLPTATPNIGNAFTELTPKMPELSSKTRKRGSILLSVDTSNAPAGIDVTGFSAKFSCKSPSGRKKSYNKNNTLGGLIKGFSSGEKCSVKVILKGLYAGKTLKSKESPSSNTVTVP